MIGLGIGLSPEQKDALLLAGFIFPLLLLMFGLLAIVANWLEKATKSPTIAHSYYCNRCHKVSYGWDKCKFCLGLEKGN